MGDDSVSPLATSHGIDDDALALRKNDSGYDDEASLLFKDGADGIFMQKPGSEGIELRRKQVVAQVHPPSPSNSNGHKEAKAKLNGMVSLSNRDIV